MGTPAREQRWCLPKVAKVSPGSIDVHEIEAQVAGAEGIKDQGPPRLLLGAGSSPAALGRRVLPGLAPRPLLGTCRKMSLRAEQAGLGLALNLGCRLFKLRTSIDLAFCPRTLLGSL